MTTSVPKSSLDGWEMVVGLEVHVQLKTRTKLFCACSAQFGAAPNANTCPVCLALPGALPVVNKQAVGLATRAALAINCEVQPVSIFARKNYFYPDSPKGYQISQFDKPLALRGWIEIGTRSDSSPIRIGVNRVHMEDDAGKSIHDRYAGATAVDLNRSGVPLIEIVSEPDIRSAEQAGAYLRVLKQILEYVDVSDVNMEEGSLRVDANVSARRRGDTKLGTKTEVKNMNSFSGVERAIDVEFARHANRDRRAIGGDSDLHVAFGREWLVELRDLVALGQIGVEVVLPRKLRAQLDLASGGDGHAHRQFHGAAVHHR